MSLLKHRHYGEHAMIVCVLVGGEVDWIPLHGTADSIVDSLSVMLTAAAAIVSVFHMSGPLCETCIDAMPLDAQEKTERRMWLLRFRHRLTDRHLIWKAVGYFAVYSVLLWIFGLTSTWTTVLGSVSTIFIAFLLFSGFVHHRLQLWCPWCRRDGGEDEQATAPDPASPVVV